MTPGGAANADAAAAAAAIAAAGGGSGDALICECKTADCGYTLFVAAGREDKFFPDGFTRPECAWGKTSSKSGNRGMSECIHSSIRPSTCIHASIHPSMNGLIDGPNFLIRGANVRTARKVEQQRQRRERERERKKERKKERDEERK